MDDDDVVLAYYKSVDRIRLEAIGLLKELLTDFELADEGVEKVCKFLDHPSTGDGICYCGDVEYDDAPIEYAEPMEVDYDDEG